MELERRCLKTRRSLGFCEAPFLGVTLSLVREAAWAGFPSIGRQPDLGCESRLALTWYSIEDFLP